jgi:hypothetical protein
MLAGLRLVRRIGLAVGAFVVVAGIPGQYTSFSMAAGAAILAFFAPSVPASSVATTEEK